MKKNKPFFASTLPPPYYAVIFTSVGTGNTDGYETTLNIILQLAKKQEGFLGIESAKQKLGISVSYWKDLKSIKKWKENTSHLEAQHRGKTKWYKAYKVRVAKVEREYEFSNSKFDSVGTDN